MYLKPRNSKVQVVMFYGNHQWTIFGFLTPKKTEILFVSVATRPNSSHMWQKELGKSTLKSTKPIEEGKL